VLQMLKQRVSRKMRKERKISTGGQMAFAFCVEGEEARAFWQAGFYDFHAIDGTDGGNGKDEEKSKTHPQKPRVGHPP
jgi:hypothetical protein